MSIIDREIEAREQRDPSYVDADLQWAWARGYKACANRETTEEEHGVGCRFTVGQLEEPSRDYGRDAYSVNNPYGRGES